MRWGTIVIGWAIAEQRSDRTLLVEGERIVSRSTAARAASALASLLIEERAGTSDRLVVAVDGAAEFLVSYLAAQQLGLVFVPVPRGEYSRNRESLLLRFRPVAAITAPSADPPQSARTFRDDDIPLSLAVETLQYRRGRRPSQVRAADDGAIAVIHLTSGTTGTPKGVMLSRRSLQYMAVTTSRVLKYTRDDRLLVTLPLSHCYGLSLLNCALVTGATVVYHSSLRPRTLCDRIEQRRCTTVDGVPSTYRVLLDFLRTRPHRAQSVAAQVRLWCCGGEPLSASLAQAFHATLGRPLLDGYGLTEAGPNIALSSLDKWRPGSVGLPLPGTRVRIDSTKADEIFVRGAGIMAGYFADPAATRRVKRDGWLATGDRGWLDADGYLYVAGRGDRQVIVNGHNVWLPDVEECVRMFRGIVEVAVVLDMSPPRRQYLSAFIVLERGVAHDGPGLKRFLSERLPPHMIPRKLQVVPTLPRGASGKVALARLVL